MKLRKVVSGAAAAFSLAAVTTSASAGGSLKDERPFSWTGFYVGAHVGVGWSEVDWKFVGSKPSDHNGDGMFVGGQVGYNWQAGGIVLGVEADGSVGSISGQAPCPNADFSCSSDVNWLASVRGRVGVTPFGARTLLYATGGWGWAGIDNQAAPGLGGFGPLSTTYSGFVAGGGIEHAASSNWTYKLEYVGYFLDDKRSSSAPIAAGIDVEPTIHTVKFGVNYKF
jgi:outer membrane immunogenic protein